MWLENAVKILLTSGPIYTYIFDVEHTILGARVLSHSSLITRYSVWRREVREPEIRTGKEKLITSRR